MKKWPKIYFYIYVPYNDNKAYEYYNGLTKELPKIKVEILPKEISPQYVLSIREKSGLLALALYEKDEITQGQPFVVPGGRFNEMYGWDSYFESVGLLIDEKSNLVKGMIENFEYQIKYYGKSFKCKQKLLFNKNATAVLFLTA